MSDASDDSYYDVTYVKIGDDWVRLRSGIKLKANEKIIDRAKIDQ